MTERTPKGHHDPRAKKSSATTVAQRAARLAEAKARRETREKEACNAGTGAKNDDGAESLIAAAKEQKWRKCQLAAYVYAKPCGHHCNKQNEERDSCCCRCSHRGPASRYVEKPAWCAFCLKQEREAACLVLPEDYGRYLPNLWGRFRARERRKQNPRRRYLPKLTISEEDETNGADQGAKDTEEDIRYLKYYEPFYDSYRSWSTERYVLPPKDEGRKAITLGDFGLVPPPELTEPLVELPPEIFDWMMEDIYSQYQEKEDWPALPEAKSDEDGIEGPDEDWDVLSTASSVWTADTVFGRGESFAEIAARHRPEIARASAKPLRRHAPVVTGQTNKPKRNEETPNDFGLAVWEDHKNGRGGKARLRFKGR